MHSMKEELERTSMKEQIISHDLSYLAYCYINEITNVEIPMCDSFDTMNLTAEDICMSYTYLLERLIEIIEHQKKDVYIDVIKVMTYLDYYYQYIS